MSSGRADRPDVDVAEELRRSVGEFVRAVRSVTDTLPGGYAEVLGTLARDGPQNISSLAQFRGVRHQTMRVTVAEMESQGLITRTPDPDDARSVLLDLTAHGHAVLNQDRAARRRAVAAAATASLTADQQAMLGQIPVILETLAAELRERSTR